MQEAYDKKAPNFVAEHAYKLAQSFSKFYAACPIVSAAMPTPASMASPRRVKVLSAIMGFLPQS